MAEQIVIDLTDYKDRIGGRIKPGRYPVVVEDAESDISSKNNPMINLWLKVEGGESDGAIVVDRLVMTPKSLFRVVNFMQAIGLPTPTKRIKIGLDKFIGQRLEIDVDDGEPYNGRIKSEVRGYLRSETRAAAASATAEAEEDLYSTNGAAAVAATPSPAQTQIPAEPEEVDLDTIDLG